MKFERILSVLAFGAFAVLGAAAVWMGGLNQDEGWYLYAAQMVADGNMPYRDFFYTQGPLLPLVYSAFTGIWASFGLLGGRVFTLAIGAAGILFAVALARRLVPEDRRSVAGLMTFLLLGSNLYHLYYLAIPKTYALASLFVTMGFFLLAAARGRACVVGLAGLALAFAAGTRISLGALLPVVGLFLLFSRRWRELAGFCVGGFLGLALVYGPFLLDARSLAGLIAAQRYHAARGGFDPVWTVGSFSRLVRWYLPIFVLLGLGVARELGRGDVRRETRNSQPLLLFFAFLAVFAVQMLAPFPYEDYQVPIMGLLAVFATVLFLGTTHQAPGTTHQAPGTTHQAPGTTHQAPGTTHQAPGTTHQAPGTTHQAPGTTHQAPGTNHHPLLLALGMTWACSFGSPLLEKWSTNGQDRFWSLKKSTYELAQLREVAREVEALDPGGKELLTQDLYLAIETGRKVPRGLEMGPFAMLTDAQWRELLHAAPCKIAALSGYSFAIRPPTCDERPLEEQIEYWSILKRKYELVAREEKFGQNQTTLLLLKRK